MSDHYYSRTPGAGHDRRVYETNLRGRTLRFVTDAGVFSKTGIDFGSRVLIETVKLPDDAHVLDVGCGYGPIGIAAAALVPQGHVTMIDINERAVELSRENAKLNKAENVTVLQSDLFGSVKDQKFDVILSNPPIRAGKTIVHRVFEEGYKLLNGGGTMWIVIQKKQGAASAEEKLLAVFGQVNEIAREKGYRIYRAEKMSSVLE